MAEPNLNGFSIVIPAFNAASTLAECLRAANSQVGGAVDAEVIVVDDGSNDRTSDIASFFGCKVIRHASPQGPAAARNHGAQAAARAVLLFVDSDILLPPDALQKIAETLARDRDLAALVASRSPESFHKNLCSRYKNYWTAFNWRKMKHANVLNSSALAVRRPVFLQLGGFDQRIRDSFYEDDDLGYRMSDNGFRIEIANDLAVVHMKRFSLRSLLRRDTNQNFVRYLVRTGRLARTVKNFRYSSVNRSFLLSYPLIMIALACLMLAPVAGRLVAPGAGLLVLVAVMNLEFWAFIKRSERKIWPLLPFILLFLLHVFCVGNAQALGLIKSIPRTRRTPPDPETRS